MSTENSKNKFNEVLLRLKFNTGVSEDQGIAALLGFDPNTFAGRKRRGALPEAQIKNLCYEKGLDFEWIMTGISEKGKIAEVNGSEKTIIINGNNHRAHINTTVKDPQPGYSGNPALASLAAVAENLDKKRQWKLLGVALDLQEEQEAEKTSEKER